MIIRKDTGNYMRWKTIQQQGPCEGQFEGICQGPKGIDVPMRHLAHRNHKDAQDVKNRLLSMGQNPNDKPGHKDRLYDSLNRPHAYRHLCPTCHVHHDKHMFDEGYQEPKWLLDKKFRQLINDRNKRKQQRRIKSKGGIVKSISEFIAKYEDFDDELPFGIDDPDYGEYDADADDVTQLEEGFGGHQENVGKPIYNTRLGFKTKDNDMTPEELKNAGKRNSLKERIARHRTPEPKKPRMGFIQDMIKEFLAKSRAKEVAKEVGLSTKDMRRAKKQVQRNNREHTQYKQHKDFKRYMDNITAISRGKPIPKNIRKEINDFVSKWQRVDPSQLPYEGTGKYKPQYEARTRLNNKLKPHEMSNRKQEVNPHSAPPMGFGAKTSNEDHLVPYRVPVDKTHQFKYRGRTYDASRMTPEEISDILAEMEQQIK